MNEWLSLGGFILSFLMSSLTVPWIVRIANRRKVFDNPDQLTAARKVHEIPTPRLGGLGFFGAFLLSYLLLAPRSPFDYLVGGSLLIFGLGFLDDLFGLSAKIRLFFQVVVALALSQLIQLAPETLMFWPGLGFSFSPVIAEIFVVFVIVGAINAFNMNDGLDGLATLTGMISILSLGALVVSKSGDAGVFYFIVGPMLGALLGFLKSNIHPADIFMGDGGSNWLGYMVGCFFLLYLNADASVYFSNCKINSFTGTDSLFLIAAIFCTMVPVVDAAVVILVRLINGQSPLAADRRHFHHGLLSLGFGHSAVVSAILVLSICFALLGILISIPSIPKVVLAASYILFFAFFGCLVYLAGFRFEEQPATKSIVGGLAKLQAKLPVLASGVRARLINFTVILSDMVGVVFGLYLAFLFRLDFFISPSFLQIFKTIAPFAVISYFIVSLAVRQYQQIFRFVTLGSVLQLFRTHFLSVVIYSGMIYFSGVGPYIPKSIILMQFCLTFIFSNVIRFIPRMIRASTYLIPDSKKPKCLVYGAGSTGDSLARLARNDPKFPYNIAGFIDDDHSKVGKFMHEYRILGSGMDLLGIASRYGVEDILVAMHSAEGEQLRTVLSHCQLAGLKVLRVPDVRKGVEIDTVTLRPVDFGDLIKRSKVRPDFIGLKDSFEGQVLLVSGLENHVMREACKFFMAVPLKSIVLVDQSESVLSEVMEELEQVKSHAKKGPTLIPCVLASSSREWLDFVFKKHAPNFVLHAPRYVERELAEKSPESLIVQTVLYTRQLIDLSHQTGVRRLVFLSSDDATSLNSFSSACLHVCEQMIQSLSGLSSGDVKYVALRIGQSLSDPRGIVARVIKQIKAGHSIWLTHPDAKIHLASEADICHSIALSLSGYQAAYLMHDRSGELLTELDLAQQLIRLSGLEPGRDIDIMYRGVKGERPNVMGSFDARAVRNVGDTDLTVIEASDLKSKSAVLAGIDHVAKLMSEFKVVEATQCIWLIAKNSPPISWTIHGHEESPSEHSNLN